MRDCKGGPAPLPKKILYLTGIKYPILFPFLVKNCLKLTQNYQEKTGWALWQGLQVGSETFVFDKHKIHNFITVLVKNRLKLPQTNNPNTFAGLVGKVRKNYLRKEGRVEKKARAARPPDPGLELGTCRVLGEGPPLHARGAV